MSELSERNQIAILAEDPDRARVTEALWGTIQGDEDASLSLRERIVYRISENMGCGCCSASLPDEYYDRNEGIADYMTDEVARLMRAASSRDVYEFLREEE